MYFCLPISYHNPIVFLSGYYRNLLNEVRCAGAEGIEPSLAVLETAVLPLNDAPKFAARFLVHLPRIERGSEAPQAPALSD